MNKRGDCIINKITVTVEPTKRHTEENLRISIETTLNDGEIYKTYGICPADDFKAHYDTMIDAVKERMKYFNHEKQMEIREK